MQLNILLNMQTFETKYAEFLLTKAQSYSIKALSRELTMIIMMSDFVADTIKAEFKQTTKQEKIDYCINFAGEYKDQRRMICEANNKGFIILPYLIKYEYLRRCLSPDELDTLKEKAKSGSALGTANSVNEMTIYAFCKRFNIAYENLLLDNSKFKEISFEFCTFSDFLEKEHAESENSLNVNRTGNYSLTDLATFVGKIFPQKGAAYAIGREDEYVLMKNLFPRGKKHLCVHIMFSSLKGSKEDTVQRGKLEFKLTDGMCYVSAVIETSRGIEGKYTGFAVIIRPNTKDGTCWCFLKTISTSHPELCVLQFRLRENEEEWDTRVALLMTLSSDEYRPYMLRVLLSKQAVVDSHVPYFAGHLKLNSGDIVIDTDTLDATINYFEGKSAKDDDEKIYSDIRKHFVSVDNDKVLEILNNLRSNINGRPISDMRIIHEMKLTSKTAAGNRLIGAVGEFEEYGPMVLSWFRKCQLSEESNKLIKKLDRDVQALFERLNTSTLDAEK